MDTFAPMSWFINVDLPTFGRPMMATKPVWNGVAVGVVCVGMVFFGKWLSLRAMLHQRSNPYSVNLFEVIGLLRGSSARNDAIGLFQFSRFGQTFVEQTHRFARRILLGDAAR